MSAEMAVWLFVTVYDGTTRLINFTLFTFWHLIQVCDFLNKNVDLCKTCARQSRTLFELCCVTEEFVTPLSTPPSEAEDATAATGDATKRSESVENTTSTLSESALHDKIYET